MIKYRAGYKYQLAETYRVPVGIPGEADAAYLTLREGTLTISAGYCWDGPSGPAIDTLNFMRGSLVHDALYQLIRLDLIPRSFREHADELLRAICREDGMSAVRAWWVYWGVRVGAGPSTRPSAERPVLAAP